jgi:ABC-2 type transport system permease protein
MTTILWRPLPIFTLTVRQFFGGKSVWVVTALAFLPVLFGTLYALDPSVDPPGYFLGKVIFRDLVIATLLPITVLIFATGAFGNEIEDQTLPYITLKPVRRLRIVIEKLVATLVVATPIILAGLTVTYLIVFRGDAGKSDNLTYLWAMLVSAAAGILAYASVFLFVGLLISRALLAGVTYALIWESLLGKYLPGLKVISIRQYAESIFVGMADDPDIALKGAAGVTASVITIVAITLMAILLATWRLRNLNLE